MKTISALLTLFAGSTVTGMWRHCDLYAYFSDEGCIAASGVSNGE